MTSIATELETLYHKIMAAPESSRLGYQAQLAGLVEKADEQGEPVSAEIRLLNEELVNAVIEDQFDNMPV